MEQVRTNCKRVEDDCEIFPVTPSAILCFPQKLPSCRCCGLRGGLLEQAHEKEC